MTESKDAYKPGDVVSYMCRLGFGADYGETYDTLINKGWEPSTSTVLEVYRRLHSDTVAYNMADGICNVSHELVCLVRSAGKPLDD